jgi:hypothetical protein
LEAQNAWQIVSSVGKLVKGVEVTPDWTVNLHDICGK